MKREPFNINDPFDQLAELAKCEIADAGLRIVKAAAAFDLPEGARIQATLAGVMTGVCGLAQAHFDASERNQRELLKVLAEYLPWAFDQARNCKGLSPLSDKKGGRMQ